MNTSPLNSAPLNSAPPTSILTVADYSILEFDGYSLQTTEIISKTIRADSAPNRELVRFSTPRDHGGRIIGDYFRERRIQVSGIVKSSTADALQTTLDTMKRRLSVGQANLDYKVNGAVRRIPATLANPEQIFAQREYYHITYCPFDLEFLALDPFFHDLEYTSYTNVGVTNLAYSNNVENLGTFKSQAVLVFIIGSATSVTALEFLNNTNSQGIEVAAAFAAGDILTIDGEERSVTLNGVEVDYNGIFPVFEYGTNSYTVNTTGTDIEYTMTAKFKQSYL